MEVCEVSCDGRRTRCLGTLRLLVGHQSDLIGAQVSPGPVNQRSWLFVAQCWLAVDKADGRVERMLRVCTQGLGFAEVLRRTVHLETLVLDSSLR